MKRINRLFLSSVAATILIFLSGCSSLNRTVRPSTEVYLSRDVRWQLPDLQVLPGQFELTQLVQATYDDNTFDFLFQIERQADRLVMAAMTPNGQPLLQAVYQKGEVSGTVSPLVGQSLSLAYLVSDFMLAFGERKPLQPALQKSGVAVKQSPEERTISYQGQPIIVIRYSAGASKHWPEKVEYRNHALNYRLQINTLNHTSL